jgi:hypothetical protein
MRFGRFHPRISTGAGRCRNRGRLRAFWGSISTPPGLHQHQAGPIPGRLNWLGRGRMKKTTPTEVFGCTIEGAQEVKSEILVKT